MKKCIKYTRNNFFVLYIICIISLLMRCTDSPTENNNNVNINLSSFTSLIPGVEYQVEGIVEANSDIDKNAFTFNFKNSSNYDVNDYFTVTTLSFDAKPKIDLKDDLGLKIKPSLSIPTGSYTFTLSVNAGEATSSKNQNFQILLVNTDNVEITITTFDSLTAGATKSIQGEIKASPDIDESEITVAITKGGTDVVSDFIVVKNDIEPMGTIDLAADLGLRITPKADISGGAYVFSLQVTAGTASSSKSVNFGIAGGTSDLVTVDLTLGSWNNQVIGSSLDADQMAVFINDVATVNSAIIDIWYSNNVSGDDVFFSPKQAAIAGYPPMNWATQNETTMANVSTIITDFDDVTSQAQIDAIWAGITGKVETLRLNPNDILMLQTDQGKACLIQFISGDGSDTGTCTIKAKKQVF